MQVGSFKNLQLHYFLSNFHNFVPFYRDYFFLFLWHDDTFGQDFLFNWSVSLNACFCNTVPHNVRQLLSDYYDVFWSYRMVRMLKHLQNTWTDTKCNVFLAPWTRFDHEAIDLSLVSCVTKLRNQNSWNHQNRQNIFWR